MKKIGRPKKGAESGGKQAIIDAAVSLIKSKGAEEVTVRNVCEAADVSIATFYHYFENKDDLMMYFVQELSFDTLEFSAPVENVPARITELYMHLIRRYMDLGVDFMRQFYSTENSALSAYMGQVNNSFVEGTVMARCEHQLKQAQEQGVLSPDLDVHTASEDVCTIVKGCVFEWCLCDGDMDIEQTLFRIIKHVFQS